MFAGFTPETFDFLWGIRLNNNREWFEQHKEEYLTRLYRPMKELGAELYEAFPDKDNTQLKVSRIYRDARRHYPVPYKESLLITIRKAAGEDALMPPCLYFEILPEGVNTGFFFWHPAPAAMAQFRRDIAEKPEPFLALMENTKKVTGLTLGAECYKRPSAAPDPRLQPYYAWKAKIGCARRAEPSPALFTPELKDDISTLFEQLLPVYTFFNGYNL